MPQALLLTSDRSSFSERSIARAYYRPHDIFVDESLHDLGRVTEALQAIKPRADIYSSNRTRHGGIKGRALMSEGRVQTRVVDVRVFPILSESLLLAALQYAVTG